MTKIYCFFAMLLCFSRGLLAFDPITHLWIAQEILNDLREDGRVEITGVEYDVPSKIRNAILKHPAVFRLGNLGPDAHPDILVGQMLIHPGEGRASDEWFATLQQSADSAKDVAYAYGAWGHAAADIFSHTYVNTYTGDVFELKNGEAEVEARHFILEKYIGKRTPKLVNREGEVKREDVLDTPKFLADYFVFNDNTVAVLKRSSHITSHLIAMNAAYRFSKYLHERLKFLEIDLPNFVFKAHKDFIKSKGDFDTIKASLDAFYKAVKAKEQQAASIRKGLDKLHATKKRLDKGLSKTRDRIGVRKEEIKRQKKQLRKWARELSKTPDKIEKRVRKWVNEVVEILPGGNVITERVRKTVTILVDNPVYNKLKSKIKKMEKDLRRDVRKRDKYLEREMEFIAELRPVNAAIKASNRAYDKTIAGLEKGKKDVGETVEKLKEAEKEYDKQKERIERLTEKNIRKLTKLAGNWHDDVKTGIHEYMRAGTGAISAAMYNEGFRALIKPISRWMDCWIPVLTMAIPKRAALGLCGIKHQPEDWLEEAKLILRTELSRSELGRRYVRAYDDKKNWVKEKILRSVEKGIQREYRGFFNVLTSDVSRDLLDDTFKRDNSKLNLVTYKKEKFSKSVDLDLGSEKENAFNPNLFRAAKNALVMAKLALLGGHELNQISKRYGMQSLYSVEFVNALHKVAHNIDGHCHWTGQSSKLERSDYHEEYSTFGYNRLKEGFPFGFSFYQPDSDAQSVFRQMFETPMTQLKNPCEEKKSENSSIHFLHSFRERKLTSNVE